MIRRSIKVRSFASLLVVFCLLAAPVAVLAKKGDKNYKRGLEYESAQQWEKAAQEFTLAVAADPSNVEYQLHYRRAVFNASQTYMQQGRALAEQRDYLGAYNAFRQAYGYDPVNELALSEMARMQRLHREKTGEAAPGENGASKATYTQGDGATPAQPSPTGNQIDPNLPSQRTDQLRVIKYNGDLKAIIRQLAEQLGLNVIFDSQTFRTPRSVEVNLTDVTTAQALDLIFIQESLFFQKLNRRTIMVADQNRRAQYQQLVLRTFYLANIKPDDARNIIAAAIPPNQGRPQTVVLPDKDTNSITIRDTPENLRLIGELIQSIDKDRAEVVMDVNIYEVSRNDLMQFGNQIGTPGSSGVFSLGGSPGLSVLSSAGTVSGGPGVNLSAITGAVPTALAAALVIPPSIFTAFQSKDRTKLVASTQVHAFNNEESQARIGQRVPVQTAQTYPFSTTPTTGGTGGTGTTGGVFSGGFPVIQYEPTGLTLKFTPQVFPNLDVQVKMNIESKDILNAGSLTPTFTERTITGTARIQNNRTMMLASVATDTQSNGRKGLPILGLIPILGRLFTSPTRANSQIDIVIAVTPRVLRAPAVTPDDERERPSGTLQTPTNSSLEAMMDDVYREEQQLAAKRQKRDAQLAAARNIPNNVEVQLPDAEPAPSYVPAPTALMPAGNGGQASATRPQPAAVDQGSNALLPSPGVQTASALAKAISQLTGEEPPQPAALVDRKNGAAPAPLMVSQPAGSVLASAPSAAAAVPVEAILMSAQREMRVGEKQRVALILSAKEPLGNAVLRLRFDPARVAVRNVSAAPWADGSKGAPTLMQSLDPSGTVALALLPQPGSPIKPGANVVLYLEVEAVAAGEGVIGFDPASANVMTADGRSVKFQLTESRLTVK